MAAALASPAPGSATTTSSPAARVFEAVLSEVTFVPSKLNIFALPSVTTTLVTTGSLNSTPANDVARRG